ncbi:MAG: SAM-dependent methyltransferase [Acidobacteriota bacterium]
MNPLKTMRPERAADGVIGLVEHGWLPDALIRWGIRRLCAERLRQEARQVRGLDHAQATRAFIASMEHEPVAPVPHRANDQHYEVPTRLFQLMLGARLKYSSAFWATQVSTLDEAEEASLALTAQHAALDDGATVLELGCGWGSLSLWMAERYPNSRILGVSNSPPQRQYIEEQARRRGLGNLEVQTADMNVFQSARRFDRIVSVEMFEHMRNYPRLFARLGDWIAPGGQLFVHVFCHRKYSYRFEERGATNWMARHFFSGGLMPGMDLLPSVPGRFELAEQWLWDGTHYQRTADAWLTNLDANRAEALEVLAGAHGPIHAARWLGRWRLFLMACAELFGYRGGHEWGVAHYRFSSPAVEGRGAA